LITSLLSACAASPPAPTNPPDPTKTSFPQGTFIGCVYFKGELVRGFFNIYDENENFVKDVEGGQGDCAKTVLKPGQYWFEAVYTRAPECTDGGCYPEEDMILLDVQNGDLIEMDFEVFVP
jgi:hypothetical protein